MDLETLFNAGVVNAIDLAFARMAMRMDPAAGEWIGLAAALVSRATTDGDVCLDLASVCDRGISHTGMG